VTADTLARTKPLEQWNEALSGLPETVQVKPKSFISMVGLRLDPADSAAGDVGSYLGVDLPTMPSTWVESDRVRVIWLGPDEWLITSPFQQAQELEAGLRDAVRGRGAVVDVSAQRTTLWLTGENARDVLAAGCAIDLHPRVFRSGATVETLLGLTSVVLLALNDSGTSYEILVRSSFAQYLARFLLDAAIEYSDAQT
jgi:sarcosine oxidase, subunit gamma